MEEGLRVPEGIWESFHCEPQDIRNYSPLALAYIGDCVYELIIRTAIVEKGNRKPEKLHKESSEFSRAATQKKIYEALLTEVTEEEAEVLRRGKNARFHTKAKNATIGEYRGATALEALFGYLYLTGKTERALSLLQIGLKKCRMEL